MGKFQVKASGKGTMFNLLATNGQVIATSEVYADKAGKFRFRLKAKNGQVIAVGEAYETKKAVLAGVASVKKNAPGAKIVEA